MDVSDFKFLFFIYFAVLPFHFFHFKNPNQNNCFSFFSSLFSSPGSIIITIIQTWQKRLE